MFRSQDARRKNRNLRMMIIASVTIVCAIVTITLLAVFIPKNKAQLDPDRLECPGFNDKEDCSNHGCTYDPVTEGPACFMKKDEFGYTLEESTPTTGGIKAKLSSKLEQTPYGPSIATVSLEVDYITENILRVKLLDASSKRYEVPVQKEFPLLKNRPTVDTSKLVYEVVLTKTSQTFSYKILRKDGTVLWDTSIGGLVMSDKFLQIASYLPSEYIFGLGENTRETLRHEMNYATWPMYSRDRYPDRGEINLYGVHPFYTCLENSTKSHGVLFLNSNAMEVTLMPSPAISFRTIGGVLDFFYFVGDNPEHVVQLYTSLIGRPLLPPYWSLGFQLSRYGYTNLNDVKEVVERTRNAGLPQDVQFLDIDYMDGYKDFTFDSGNFSGLADYMKETQKNYGMKWIIIIDPAIAAAKNYAIYDTALEKNLFIKRASWWNKDIFPEHLRDNNVTFGKVWPKEPAGFPDFFLEETKHWWVESFIKFHKELPFDGLWIDMNEPSNFGTNGEDYEFCDLTNVPRNECWVLKCPTSAYEDPPYQPLLKSGSPKLSSKTICMESRQGTDDESYLHYDVHSLYGLMESVATLEAAEKSTGTRSIVISRSTYPSSGRYCGHWLGDNKSIWRDMHDSVIGMMAFNLFGIPYIGADVCGFGGKTTEELCARWMQLGAFYPFYRNHNLKGYPDQDPVSMGEYVTDISRKAIERRYTLLPYLYTLFYRAHVDGVTVVRPLFHEFASDKTTWNIDEQFMWGKCLIISPVLKENVKTVTAYLPKGEWWEFNYENSTEEKVSEQYVVKTADDSIPIHIKGGCILPTEDAKLRTPSKDEIRQISLYIFPASSKASGELFIDDGISKDTVEQKAYDLYKYELNECDLEIKKDGKTNYKGVQPKLKQIILFKTKDVETVNVDSKFAKFTIKDKNILIVDINADMNGVTKISWRNKENKCST